MTRRRKSVATALILTSASAVTAYVVRRRRTSPRPHVGLYFEDGSMVSLPESSPQAAPLVTIGRDVVQLVQGA